MREEEGEGRTIAPSLTFYRPVGIISVHDGANLVTVFVFVRSQLRGHAAFRLRARHPHGPPWILRHPRRVPQDAGLRDAHPPCPR